MLVMYQHFSLYYRLPHHHQPPHPQLNQPHHQPPPQLNQLHHQPKYLVGFIRPKEESPNQAESERVNVEKEPLSKDSHEVSVALRTSTL
jgi:hypothetical protein